MSSTLSVTLVARRVSLMRWYWASLVVSSAADIRYTLLSLLLPPAVLIIIIIIIIIFVTVTVTTTVTQPFSCDVTTLQAHRFIIIIIIIIISKTINGATCAFTVTFTNVAKSQ